MKHVLAAAVAAAAFAPAFAADTFNGFHAGAQLGYGQYETGWFDKEDDWSGATYNFSAEGFLYGVHAGYDRQLGSLVLGGELDASFSTLDDDSRSTNDGVSYSNKVNYLISLRLRAGLAVDTTQLYLLAGPALGSIDHEWKEDGDPSDSWDFSNDGVGFVLGVGLEHQIAAHWTLRGEAVRYTLPRASDMNQNGYTMQVSDEVTALVLGADYRF
jgi:outer membrane immunogenic protein